MLDYVFATASHDTLDYLAFAFTRGQGFLGYRNTFVIEADGELVGVGAFYSAQEYRRLNLHSIQEGLEFFGWRHTPGVFLRAMDVKSVMPAPSRTEYYAANLAISSRFQGLGLMRNMLLERMNIAAEAGYHSFCLDVQKHNQRAISLYEAIGMVRRSERMFPNQRCQGTIRMVKPLSTLDVITR